MKRINFIIAILFVTMASFSGVSNSPSPSITPPEEMARDPRFRTFLFNFLEHIKQYSSLYQVPQLEKPLPFYNAITQSNGEEETVANIYSNFSLDFEEAMVQQNNVDNDLLQVMRDFPELQDMEEQEVWRTITAAGAIVVRETSDDDLEVQRVMPPGEKGLDLEEVWDCALEALGVGVGSLISIAAIQKLAKEKGIQAVVVSVSKFLAKKAGWIGAISTLIDFSLCINRNIYD